jgi:N-acetylglucosaminyldiphosphoundecaprenol N-acetyl-beta-D-mannosaminyltransferase
VTDHPEVDILGIRVDNLTYEQVLARVDEFIKQGGAHQVNTVNPEFIITAQRDAEFARILNGSSLNLPDGQGLIWAAGLLATPLQQRVTGVDALIRLAQMAAQRGYRVYLLGAAEGVAEIAARRLKDRFPDLEICGAYAGSPAVQEEKGITSRIAHARPHLLFVAYGAPHQEKWIARNLGRTGVPVAMGVGGALDFISGHSKRAPTWVQTLGLEWLHRLAHEPWRWRRMMALPRFVLLVLRERLT